MNSNSNKPNKNNFIYFVILMKFLVINIILLAYILYASELVEKKGSSYYDLRIEQNKTTPKVYDVLHRYLPDLHSYPHLNDIFTVSMVIPILFYRYITVDYISYWIVIFFIRAITSLTTILPKYKKCEKGKSLFGGCYDKLFSGHFSSGLLATLMYLDYNIIGMPAVVMLNTVNALLIVLQRSHYTADIIMAFFVTMFVYQNKLKF